MRLTKLRHELADLRARFSEKYPDVIRVRSEIASLEKRLAEEPEPVAEPKAVPQATAGTQKKAKDPVAATWWREHCAHLLDGKRSFLFPSAGCEERP